MIIDSSIWVATMTGLARRGTTWTARFCTSGTCSSGISTPRSPRATMIAVERVDDRLQALDRLGLLDLRDHRDGDADLVHDAVDQLDVLGRADERQRDEVDAEPQREPQVLGVLVGQRRHADRDAGQRQALVVADTGPPSMTSQTTSVPLDLDHDQRDVAVVDEQPVAGRDVVGEVLVGGGHPVAVPATSSTVMRTRVAGRPLDRARRRSVPSRILGPCRSASTATARPVPSAACRTSLVARPWSACAPWLKFSRATSMPASTRRGDARGVGRRAERADDLGAAGHERER